MSPIRLIPITGNRSFSVDIRLAALCLPLAILALLAGCGGGDADPGRVLAEVDGKPITAEYYENRLAKMEKAELPRADDGTVLDTATVEGQRAFLDILVNKEIMVAMGERMGFDQDPVISEAKKNMTAYEAGIKMWQSVVAEPNDEISNEEFDVFYENLDRTRRCYFLITNFREDAEAARQEGLAGADWDDLVYKYHDGGQSPTGTNEITVRFGQFTEDFESGVFDTEVGGISEPIETEYGFWLLKVLNEKRGERLDRKEAEARILDAIHFRKTNRTKNEFMARVHERFKFNLNEDALWTVYLGLPDKEELFLPGTQTPVPREELEPLDIAPADLDMPFFSYVDVKGEEFKFTVGDYKIRFDNMSVFKRPKKESMLGGLRSKVTEDVNLELLNFMAEDLGFYEDPEVVAKIDVKIEELMVHKLYKDLVPIEERVTAEEMEAFWAEHADEYVLPETRDGAKIVCANAAQAQEAKDALAAGTDWRDVLLKYGTDKDNKAAGGRFEKMRLVEGDPVSTALFALAEGQISDPVDDGDGKVVVLRLDKITPGGPAEIADVGESLAKRIRSQRQEAAFTALLDEWRSEIPNVVHEDRLGDLKSWEELTAVGELENVVPRN